MNIWGGVGGGRIEVVNSLLEDAQRGVGRGGSGEAARAAPQARPGVRVDSLTLTLKRTVGGAEISRPRCPLLRPVRASNWIWRQRGGFVSSHVLVDSWRRARGREKARGWMTCWVFFSLAQVFSSEVFDLCSLETGEELLKKKGLVCGLLL